MDEGLLHVLPLAPSLHYAFHLTNASARCPAFCPFLLLYSPLDDARMIIVCYMFCPLFLPPTLQQLWQDVLVLFPSIFNVSQSIIDIEWIRDCSVSCSFDPLAMPQPCLTPKGSGFARCSVCCYFLWLCFPSLMPPLWLMPERLGFARCSASCFFLLPCFSSDWFQKDQGLLDALPLAPFVALSLIGKYTKLILNI